MVTGCGDVAHRNDILTGLWIMIGFMTFSLMLDVLDSVQTGHQELTSSTCPVCWANCSALSHY